ncbi:MAG: hypothetical protein ACREGA_00500 [Candidatus Saccharimonadales bacterium]
MDSRRDDVVLFVAVGTLEPAIQITIHKIELKNYNYPLVEFTTEVSSGTYIRSLVEDLGKNLKTGAYMSGLNRTKVGKFETKKALNLQNLNAEQILKSFN